MKAFTIKVLPFLFLLLLASCGWGDQEREDQIAVNRQQEQYARGQPVPFFDWSLERDLVIQLYNLRNNRVATHTVWRSDYGMIEGDCPSMGFGIPYDTSLTNPLQLIRYCRSMECVEGVVGQAEPNGVYASTNTQATWVLCVREAGIIAPHYVESKVTAYPYPVKVDYEKSRVTEAGKPSVTIKVSEEKEKKKKSGK